MPIINSEELRIQLKGARLDGTYKFNEVFE